MLIFYDTCALLSHFKEIFDEDEVFYVSSLTINELENIKTSGLKDEETKYNARCLLHKLKENKDKCIIIPFRNRFLSAIDEFDLPNTTDSKIIATAFDFYKNPGMEYPSDKKLFCTDDLACETIARSIGLPIFTFDDGNEEEYTGYKEVEMDDDTLADFYNHEQQRPLNRYNLVINQYLIIRQNDRVVDKYKWTGSSYEQVQFIHFESKMFGKITPKDVYQNIAMDSMKSNSVTLIGGPAGSGKTFLALGYLFSELERDHISKIVIFCNPCGARGAAKLGWYKGTVLEKLLATQVGHVLSSKLGGEEEIEYLIDHHMLEIIPAVDARGYETPADAGVYILESQNLTSDLLRLLLQRCSDTAKVIIDGDRLEQLDDKLYASDNGMKKMSHIFKGEDIYGQVDLQKIYRSRIAEIADKMKY